MLHQRIELSAAGGYMTTYLLEPSTQIQIGKRHPLVLVCPGGAYLRTSDQEGEQVALHFATLGCHAAVLRYSCGEAILDGVEAGGLPNPLVEIARAIALLRDRAEEWRIDPHRIIVNGYSAGGHLCALACTAYAELAAAIGRKPEDVRPDAAVLGYPCIDLEMRMPLVPLNGFTVGEIDPVNPRAAVHPLFLPAYREVDGAPRMDFRQAMLKVFFGTAEPGVDQLRAYSPYLGVNADTPPSFVWATSNDNLVPAVNSIKYVQALWDQGVPCEFHLFSDGPHGLSLADETVADGPEGVNPEVAAWFSLAKAWLKHRGLTD